MNLPNNIEVETTLAICSDSPEEIVAEIAELTCIGPYELRHKIDLNINDLYIDLASQKLRSVGFGLRIREVDGSKLVTLKGKPQKVPGGGIRRDELELPWSSAALGAITTRLEEHGVALFSVDSDVESRDPLSVFLEMGFRVEQRRHTRRRPRDVMLGTNPRTTVAELVVDSVGYHFDAGIIRHHEIEIEQKLRGTVEDIQAVRKSLLSRRPDVLREWHFGKRSTGREAEALLGEFGPARVVSTSGNLLPDAYDLIRARLE